MQRVAAPAWERIAVFAFGVIFIITMLVLAVKFPNPKEFPYTVFRIVLAVAIAGVAAFVPGFLQVNVNGIVRAGGAMAVFVIVYFFSPAKLVSDPIIPPPPIEDAQKTIESWQQKVDTEQYAKAWEEASEATQHSFYKNVFVDLFQKQRSPLGPPISRKLHSVVPMQALPDGQKGNFVTYAYQTRFTNSNGDVLEYITVKVEKGGWKVLYHVMGPMPNFGGTLPH